MEAQTRPNADFSAPRSDFPPAPPVGEALFPSGHEAVPTAQGGLLPRTTPLRLLGLLLPSIALVAAITILGFGRLDALSVARPVTIEPETLADAHPDHPDRPHHEADIAAAHLGPDGTFLPRAVPPEQGTRPFRVVETLMMEVTAYCPCTRCCGPNAQGITASGRPVAYNAGRFVAADTRLLPFGTRLRIPGYHDAAIVEVIDRGGAIKGLKLDVYFDDHETARAWGRQMLPIQIVELIEDGDSESESPVATAD